VKLRQPQLEKSTILNLLSSLVLPSLLVTEQICTEYTESTLSPPKMDLTDRRDLRSYKWRSATALNYIFERSVLEIILSALMHNSFIAKAQ
jgi:hypothetical protein